MKITQILIAASVAVLLSSSAFAADKASYDKAAASATAENKAAKAAGNEWRDTGKMLKAAAKSADKKDYASATATAKAAEFQGKMAQQQAAEQKAVGNPSYLY